MCDSRNLRFREFIRETIEFIHLFLLLSPLIKMCFITDGFSGGFLKLLKEQISPVLAPYYTNVLHTGQIRPKTLLIK